MFVVFAVLFYRDGSTGYREKNLVYYLHAAFEPASRKFSEMNADQKLDPASWEEYASAQRVEMPEDTSILPADAELPLSWPEPLRDYDRMKGLQWKKLWQDYSAAKGLDIYPPEKPYDSRSIRAQWIVFYICVALSVVVLFFLVRTLLRKVIADEEILVTADGRRIAYSDMHQLDLRRWYTKGIAHIAYENSAGKGRARIDGLTYGGFSKENDQPAERLMERIRSKFSGELIEYAQSDEDADDEDAQTATDIKTQA
ncbi:MAG: hypothetical protein R3242_02845 [Akkermansiaceae bacterium]|nr:hypothetical protein [Akkermansiaceae bacterium]